jgi:acetyl-CoA carboxylase biotin carboxyl carrier protein
VLRRPEVEGDTGPTADTEEERPRAAVPEGMVAVHPPLLGTFFRAPQPGAPPFVDVGDEVDEETVVGIVETMKMMTPVHAGVRGTVVEFRLGNGEFAEADAVLLVVDPA